MGERKEPAQKEVPENCRESMTGRPTRRANPFRPRDAHTPSNAAGVTALSLEAVAPADFSSPRAAVAFESREILRVNIEICSRDAKIKHQT